jgi:hypothetical protein
VHKDYKKVVEETWRSQMVTGWVGFVLREKLKSIKSRLKVWSKEEFGGMDDRISSLIDDS